MAANRSIKDFFKPYTIPRHRIPDYESEDEIIVARFPPGSVASQPEQQQPKHTKPSLRNTRSPPRKTASPGNATTRKQGRERGGMSSAASTPKKKSPRNYGTAREAYADAASSSSALISLLSSQSSTPTRVRKLDAVMIPSPRRETSAQPAPAILPSKPNRSFSSVSSSVPHGSQSSSRRIIKNGVKAVANSDSASVSSSDDDLADFDNLMPQKRRRLTPPHGRHATDTIGISSGSTESLRTSTRLRAGRSADQYRSAYRPPSPPPTVTYKHSLFKIVKQNQKQAASEAKIAEAVAKVHEAESKDVATELTGGDGSAGAIAAAFTSTSEDYERMKAAIERTEAMKAEETFYFFGSAAASCVEAMEAYNFDVVEKSFDFLECEGDLRFACTSGFLSALATKMSLTSRLVRWIQKALLVEHSEELCDAYVAVIDAVVCSGGASSNNFTSLRLAQLFPNLQSDVAKETGRRQLPMNLKHVLQAMRVLVRVQSHTQCVADLADLVMLNNDERVRLDVDLQNTIEKLMNSLLLQLEGTLDTDGWRGNDDTWSDLVKKVIDNAHVSRHILARAISSIPATTPILHDVRRRLALHVLLEATGDVDISHTSPDTGVRLLVKLKHHKDFVISESTDYTLLLSLTFLLDIAIDAGFSDFAFVSQANPPPANFAVSTSSIFSDVAKPTLPKETAFNAQVDAIAAQLTQMKNRIRDAGTSHLKRTEAKSALDRLVVRLEYAVRTRLKPRNGVFDSRIKVSSGLGAFLKRTAGGAEAAEGKGTVDDAPNS